MSGVEKWLVFLKANQENFVHQSSVLPSLDALGWFIFVKYYVGRRVPSKRSDLGDMSIISYMPYEDSIITEGDVGSILKTVLRRVPDLVPPTILISKNIITQLEI